MVLVRELLLLVQESEDRAAEWPDRRAVRKQGVVRRGDPDDDGSPRTGTHGPPKDPGTSELSRLTDRESDGQSSDRTVVLVCPDHVLRSGDRNPEQSRSHGRRWPTPLGSRRSGRRGHHRNRTGDGPQVMEGSEDERDSGLLAGRRPVHKRGASDQRSVIMERSQTVWRTRPKVVEQRLHPVRPGERRLADEEVPLRRASREEASSPLPGDKVVILSHGRQDRDPKKKAAQKWQSADRKWPNKDRKGDDRHRSHGTRYRCRSPLPSPRGAVKAKKQGYRDLCRRVLERMDVDRRSRSGLRRTRKDGLPADHRRMLGAPSRRHSRRSGRTHGPDPSQREDGRSSAIRISCKKDDSGDERVRAADQHRVLEGREHLLDLERRRRKLSIPDRSNEHRSGSEKEAGADLQVRRSIDRHEAMEDHGDVDSGLLSLSQAEPQKKRRDPLLPLPGEKSAEDSSRGQDLFGRTDRIRTRAGKNRTDSPRHGSERTRWLQRRWRLRTEEWGAFLILSWKAQRSRSWTRRSRPTSSCGFDLQASLLD